MLDAQIGLLLLGRIVDGQDPVRPDMLVPSYPSLRSAKRMVEKALLVIPALVLKLSLAGEVRESVIYPVMHSVVDRGLARVDTRPQVDRFDLVEEVRIKW
jgi:hypothetical protein